MRCRGTGCCGGPGPDLGRLLGSEQVLAAPLARMEEAHCHLHSVLQSFQLMLIVWAGLVLPQHLHACSAVRTHGRLAGVRRAAGGDLDRQDVAEAVEALHAAAELGAVAAAGQRLTQAQLVGARLRIHKQAGAASARVPLPGQLGRLAL